MNDTCAKCPLINSKTWFFNPWIYDPYNSASSPFDGVPLLVLGTHPMGEDAKTGRHLSTEWGEWLFEILQGLKTPFAMDGMLRCSPEGDMEKRRKLKQEAACLCRNHWTSFVCDMRPKVILTLGEQVSRSVLNLPNASTMASLKAEPHLVTIQDGHNPERNHTCRVVCLPHPCTHNAFMYYEKGGKDLRGDVKAAMNLVYGILEGSYADPGAVDYELITHLHQVPSAVKFLQSECSPGWAYDCETHNPHPVTWAPENELLCFGVGAKLRNKSREYRQFVFDIRHWSMGERVEAYQQLLPGATLIGTNIMYDLQWIYAGTAKIIDPRDYIKRVEDTCYLSYLPNQQKWNNGLEPQAQHKLGIPGWKHHMDLEKAKILAMPEVKKAKLKWGYGLLHTYAREKLLRYQAKDVWAQSRLWWEYYKSEEFRKTLQDIAGPYKLMMDSIWAFIDIEREGLHIDLGKMRRVKKNIEREVAHVQGLVDGFRFTKKAGLTSVNSNSPTHMAKVVQATGVQVRYVSKATELPSVDAEEIQRQSGPGEWSDKTPVQKYWTALGIIRKKRNLVSKFIDPYVDLAVDNRIRCRFHLNRSGDTNPGTGKDFSGGIDTGRIAASDPSTHLIIKDPLIRDCYIAPPGECYADIDFTGAEVAILGVAAPDPKILDIFSRKCDNPRDHRADIYKVGATRFPGWGLDWSIWDDDPKKAAYYRALAKKITLGLNYLESPEGLAARHDISLEEAEAYTRWHFAEYSGIQEYVAKTLNKVFLGEEVISPSGRRAVFPLARDYAWDYEKLWDMPFFELTKHLHISPLDAHVLRKAANFVIQSTTSDLTSSKAAWFSKWMHENKQHRKNMAMVNFVHDSIWFRLRTKTRDRYLEFIKKQMEDVASYAYYSIGLNFPDYPVLAVAGEWGQSLGDILRKG